MGPNWTINSANSIFNKCCRPGFKISNDNKTDTCITDLCSHPINDPRGLFCLPETSDDDSYQEVYQDDSDEEPDEPKEPEEHQNIRTDHNDYIVTK